MPARREPRIAIIGGGLSGITLGIELKKQLGLTSFTIYEKGDGIGGTWRWNTYPGCACDVPSHWYSLSTEKNPNWSQVYSSQPEIEEYWIRLHRKYKLREHTQYDARFVSAVWVPSKSVYEIEFARQSDQSQTFRIEAEILVSAIGGLSVPNDEPPTLKGLSSFKGEKFHSALWRHDIKLAGKRVGVIGNGCSAAQFVPEIVKDPTTHVLNFSRTPSWFFPRNDQREYSAFTKWAFSNVPFVLSAYRAIIASTMDISFINWKLSFSGVRHFNEELCRAHIRANAPEKYHDFLIPRYPIGTKRIIRDPGYLKALNLPNIELITDGIDTITEKGIRCKSGEEHEVDVLILGTGFDTSTGGIGINVRGSHGRTVTEQWDSQEGAQAYLGTTLSGFPNLYLLLGPNVGTGHASVIYSTESQVRMVEAQVQYGVDSFELKTDAEDRYNTEIQGRAQQTVWASKATHSWYKVTKRDGSEKIISMFPGTLTEFWWRTRRPNFEHYQQRGGKSVALAKRVSKTLRLLALIASIVVLRRYGYQRARTELLAFASARLTQARQLIGR